MTQIPAPRPLRPQKGLFIVLCVVFTAWIAALLIMYYTTVRPNRPAPDQRPQEKDVR